MNSTPLQLVAGQLLICPHCKAPHDPVEDFVVEGRVGMASAVSDQCEHCHAFFRVICVTPGSYEVSVPEADLA